MPFQTCMIYFLEHKKGFCDEHILQKLYFYAPFKKENQHDSE